MKKLYFITGPAGVGKTTISETIAKKLSKSVSINGDEIYHFVKGGYISPWQEGNHLDLFWENSISLINNCLNKNYDVIFNYIIDKNKINELKNVFNSFEVKFVVLMADESIIVKRDSQRPVNCQMGKRSLILLNDFKSQNFEEKYILDTSNLTIEETINIIENEPRFILK